MKNDENKDLEILMWNLAKKLTEMGARKLACELLDSGWEEEDVGV